MRELIQNAIEAIVCRNVYLRPFLIKSTQCREINRSHRNYKRGLEKILLELSVGEEVFPVGQLTQPTVQRLSEVIYQRKCIE